MKSLCFFVLLLMVSACGGGREMVVSPGRGGVAEERGPMVRVFPSGRESVEARHGRWRGLDVSGRRVWEVRYTRGNPSGPYREWNAEGVMIATWPYDWDGNLVGWLRWFEEDGTPGFKFQMRGEQPDFDPIGQAERLKAWAKTQVEE